MSIATLLQTFIGSKFFVVQGSSFAFIPRLIAIGSGIGLAAVEGTLFVGGIVGGLTGALGLIGKLKKLFSPLVTGITITLVVFSLANVAVQYSFDYFVDASDATILPSSIIALMTFITTILVALKAKRTFRTMPVITSVLVGYIMSIVFGLVDFTLVKSLPFFSLPNLFTWGTPVFDVSAIIILLFAFMVSIIESAGDYHAISTIADLPIDNKKIKRGIGSEGISCFIAGVFGACGTTSYSENIGLVALTRVSCVQVVQIGAGISYCSHSSPNSPACWPLSLHRYSVV
jgi:NCS2 family nucleobase:cation symporter-2